MEGGREGARAGLRRFWKRVAQTSPFTHLETGPLGPWVGADNPLLQTFTSTWQQALRFVGSQFSTSSTR